jgi:hypothetical protein
MPQGAAVTAAERRFWFLQERDPTGAGLVWPQALRLRGNVEVAALARAWRRLVTRHDIARTRFPDRGDGQPKRVVDPIPAGPPHVPISDLRDLGAADVPGAVDDLVAAECTATLDVRHGPLLRCRVVRVPVTGGDGEHLVLVTGHSIVLDNWSVGLLWRDLGALYRAEVTGTADGLPAVRTSVADHAARQADRIAASGAAGLERVARRRTGLPVTRLPRPERPDTTAGGSELTVSTVPAADVRALRVRLAVASASDFILLFAAFADAVGDVLGQDEIVIGTSSAGRSPDLFDTLGYFVDRVAVRIDRTRGRDLADTVRRLRRDVYAELGDSALPFEHVLEHLHAEQYLAPAPLVDVMFVLAGGSQPVDFGGPAAEIEPVAGPLARFGLLVFVRKEADGFTVHAHRGVRASAADVRAVMTRFAAVFAEAPLAVTAR